MGRSIAELSAIVDALGSPPGLGLCLDSCHLWVSGVDVSDRAAMDALLAEVDERIGLERLRAVHVNDAATALGSNSDRHANLGAGVIGRGLAAFVGHPRLRGLPQLLETPGQDGHGPDADQIRRLRELRRSRRPGRAR